MGIFELFRTGYFESFWNWSNLGLTVLVYSCVLAGIIVQIILQKRYKDSTKKWMLIGICVVVSIICEGGSHAMIGWGRLTLMAIYHYVFCILFGAIIPLVISAFTNRN